MLRILMLATVCCSTRCRSAVAGGQVRQCHRREALEKKIEKLFAEDPELAKELKAAAGLNALKAVNTALALYNKANGSTVNSKQQAEAWARYNIRSMNIQTLSGVMTLKDGKLRSAAVYRHAGGSLRLRPAPEPTRHRQPAGLRRRSAGAGRLFETI
jgi:hypothetical protein